MVDSSSGHICGFFRDRQEQYNVLLPFFQEGIQEGDKVIHVSNPTFLEDHTARLRQARIDVDRCEERRQLELMSWEAAYLREGQFDQHAMLTLVDEVLARSGEEGYPMTRLTADMDWALQDLPGVGDLVEYEARVNYLLPKYGDAVI
jgi:hypothetical protein